jgi:hypothetical protein
MSVLITILLQHQLGVRKLCLGARRAGDSNTKWLWQGVLGGAHNLLENGTEQREASQKSVLEVSKE